jgi:hypothetical protein
MQELLKQYQKNHKRKNEKKMKYLKILSVY